MIRTFLRSLLFFSLTLVLVASGDSEPGPLRASDVNPRYFTDNSGRAIYMTGSHTWASLMDMGPSDPPEAFDFDAYLDFLEGYGHNFIRLWTWELVNWNTVGNAAENRSKQTEVHTVRPLPWKRTGPGTALDGKPKFDLTQFNDEYFNRLRNRTLAAGDRDMYVSVMLFEGWGLRRRVSEYDVWNVWENHPFHPSNNINGIDSNVNGDQQGLEVHELKDKETTEIQEAYVRKVIDTVNDLDNVLYEIANESQPASAEWHNHMVRIIKEYEANKPKRHPVGVTTMKPGDNTTLFEMEANICIAFRRGGLCFILKSFVIFISGNLESMEI